MTEKLLMFIAFSGNNPLGKAFKGEYKTTKLYLPKNLKARNGNS